MSRVTVVSVSSQIAAVVFWQLSLAELLVPSMQVMGQMALTVGLAATATVIAALHKKMRLEESRDEKLRKMAEEYERREAALIRMLADFGGTPVRQRRLHGA